MTAATAASSVVLFSACSAAGPTPAKATTVLPSVATTAPKPAATTASPSTSGSPLSDDADGYQRPNIDPDNPAIVARPVPGKGTDTITTLAPPPWAGGTTVSGRGVSIDVGCARSRAINDLDAFFAERIGPVLGWDYQHVYPLGGDRSLWLFQDTFIDHSNTLTNLGKAKFVHNAALVQDGACFTLMFGGTPTAPAPFEPGDGTTTLRRWFWPMGGELMPNGDLGVFWVEMVKDPYDPTPPDGLGWHPQQTYLARYNSKTLARRSFAPAPNRGTTPVYGYAVVSDATHTYLFGNTFEQNLAREGGYWSGPHSATKVWLARVPRGRLDAAPEYRTALDWSPDPGQAQPVSERYYAENPLQPRLLNGQWVAVTAVDGYWGDHLAVDVAYDPWGPWMTVAYQRLSPRGNDPKMNTYHAHLLPWRAPDGAIQVSVSNNARNMLADAWPTPRRYRPQLFGFPNTPTPPTVPVTAPPLPPTAAPQTPAPTPAPTPPPPPPPPVTTRPRPTTTRPRPTTTRPAATTTTPAPTTTTRPAATTTTPAPTTTTTDTGQG